MSSTASRFACFLFVFACSNSSTSNPTSNPTPTPTLSRDPGPRAPDSPPARAPDSPPAAVTVERHGPITAVRVDPRVHRPVVLTALADGGSRAAPRWAADFSLVAVTNASMFHDDRRSIGLLVDGDTINNPRDNPKLGGFIAFDPIDPASSPPVTIASRGCEGFDLDALRTRYRAIVQNYRMLDCDGSPLAWTDAKRYSAAALGVDVDGNVVLLHSRRPHTMTDFNRLVAAPALKMRAAVYLEGGPEASLFVDAGGVSVREVGSFEDFFYESDDNPGFWPIPNVIGFAAGK